MSTISESGFASFDILENSSFQATPATQRVKKRTHQSLTDDQITDEPTRKKTEAIVRNIVASEIVTAIPVEPSYDIQAELLYNISVDELLYTIPTELLQDPSIELLHKHCAEGKFDEAIYLVQTDSTLLAQIEIKYLLRLLEICRDRGEFGLMCQILENTIINADIIKEGQTLKQLLYLAFSLKCKKATYKIMSSNQGNELLEALCMDKKFCENAVELIEQGISIDKLSKSAIDTLFAFIADVREQESNCEWVSDYDMYGHLAIARIADRYGMNNLVNLEGEQFSKKSAQCLRSVMRFSKEGYNPRKVLWTQTHNLPNFAIRILHNVNPKTGDSVLRLLTNQQFKEAIIESLLIRGSIEDYQLAIKLIIKNISFAHISNKETLIHFFDHCCHYQELGIAKRILQLPTVAHDDAMLCCCTAVACRYNPDVAMKILKNKFDVNKKLLGMSFGYSYLLEELVFRAKHWSDNNTVKHIQCITTVVQKGGISSSFPENLRFYLSSILPRNN